MFDSLTVRKLFSSGAFATFRRTSEHPRQVAPTSSCGFPGSWTHQKDQYSSSPFRQLCPANVPSTDSAIALVGNSRRIPLDLRAEVLRQAQYRRLRGRSCMHSRRVFYSFPVDFVQILDDAVRVYERRTRIRTKLVIYIQLAFRRSFLEEAV